MLPMKLEGTGWFPFPVLKGGFDRFFEDFLAEDRMGAYLPAMEVRETDEAFVVETELPGMKPEDVQVKFESGFLNLSAERKHEKEEKKGTVHRSERYYGRMERRIALPGEVDPEKVEASVKDGLLTVTLAKKAASRSRTVPVKAKS
jgi:HSP20 family protein